MIRLPTFTRLSPTEGETQCLDCGAVLLFADNDHMPTRVGRARQVLGVLCAVCLHKALGKPSCVQCGRTKTARQLVGEVCWECFMDR